MKRKVLILSADAVEAEGLSRILQKAKRYDPRQFFSLNLLHEALKSQPCIAVILDVDSVPVDNRTIRDLTLQFPSVSFFCVSREHFHPELKDAICYHIFACLNKPIDPDELLYFLRCIDDNDADSRDPPAKMQAQKKADKDF